MSPLSCSPLLCLSPATFTVNCRVPPQTLYTPDVYTGIRPSYTCNTHCMSTNWVTSLGLALYPLIPATHTACQHNCQVGSPQLGWNHTLAYMQHTQQVNTTVKLGHLCIAGIRPLHNCQVGPPQFGWNHTLVYMQHTLHVNTTVKLGHLSWASIRPSHVCVCNTHCTSPHCDIMNTEMQYKPFNYVTLYAFVFLSPTYNCCTLVCLMSLNSYFRHCFIKNCSRDVKSVTPVPLASGRSQKNPLPCM
jgi:hypothetical protein